MNLLDACGAWIFGNLRGQEQVLEDLERSLHEHLLGTVTEWPGEGPTPAFEDLFPASNERLNPGSRKSSL